MPRAGQVPWGALISSWTHHFKRVLPSFPLMGNFLVVQWLGFGTFISGAPGSIPGQGSKIPQASWCDKKKLTLDKLESTERKSGQHSKVPSPRGEMTEGMEMPLKRRGQCLQASVCPVAASGCGSFSQGCTPQERSSGRSSILGQGAHQKMMDRRCRF